MLDQLDSIESVDEDVLADGEGRVAVADRGRLGPHLDAPGHVSAPHGLGVVGDSEVEPEATRELQRVDPELGFAGLGPEPRRAGTHHAQVLLRAHVAHEPDRGGREREALHARERRRVRRAQARGEAQGDDRRENDGAGDTREPHGPPLDGSILGPCYHPARLMRIEPASFVRGRFTLPGDKSISHRAALIGAMATGTTRVRNFSSAADCASTLACLRGLGVTIRQEGEELLYTSSMLALDQALKYTLQQQFPEVRVRKG